VTFRISIQVRKRPAGTGRLEAIVSTLCAAILARPRRVARPTTCPSAWVPGEYHQYGVVSCGRYLLCGAPFAGFADPPSY
jgi:hypothetical protein